MARDHRYHEPAPELIPRFVAEGSKAKRWQDSYQGQHDHRPICLHCSDIPFKAVYLVAVYRRQVDNGIDSETWGRRVLVKVGYYCRSCHYFEPIQAP